MKKYVYTANIPMRWFDMDAFGHVNNSLYLTYFEEARTQWWASLGMKLEAKQEGPILLNAQCTYLKPIVYPEDLQVKLYAGPPGRSSFTLFYDIVIKDDPEDIHSAGSTKVVWLDYQRHQSKPLPDFILKELPERVKQA